MYQQYQSPKVRRYRVLAILQYTLYLTLHSLDVFPPNGALSLAIDSKGSIFGGSVTGKIYRFNEKTYPCINALTDALQLNHHVVGLIVP
jgi:hypothetical protein